MKRDRDEGAVYVRWGHDKCPSTAQLVYSGRAGGSSYDQFGSGTNLQCLPLDPNNHAGHIHKWFLCLQCIYRVMK